MSNGSTVSPHCWTNNVRQFDQSLTVQVQVYNQKFRKRTIEELYLKNKRLARSKIVLQRKLQYQEVQVASENHQRRRVVRVGYVSSRHVGLCLGLASLDLDQTQSILNVRNVDQLHNLGKRFSS